MIFSKGARAIPQGKQQSSTNGTRKTGYAFAKGWDINSPLYIKIN